MKLLNHRVHAATGAHGVVGDRDHHAHLQDELKEISPQHAPESAERDIETSERNDSQNADQQSRVRTQVREDHEDDADHGLRDPAQDEAVHE